MGSCIGHFNSWDLGIWKLDLPGDVGWTHFIQWNLDLAIFISLGFGLLVLWLCVIYDGNYVIYFMESGSIWDWTHLGNGIRAEHVV
jgi:hypothetical protein